ncbi:MAG: hypothetical protein FJZ96_02135 [Chloroflexi bacterium]|nr:hypothetical protein [Chloroflexota bacterium]
MKKSIALLLVFLHLFLAMPAAAVTNSRPREIPEPYDLVAENTDFQLYVNPESLAFKLLDKRNGYIWSSSLDEKMEGDRLNRTWTAFASSGFSIDYLDTQANTQRLSITNSEHTMEIRTIENGIQAQVTFTEVAISVGLRLQLEQEGVRVEVPFDTLRQDGKFRLEMLYLYPWMGATRGGQTPGYMFLPDGSGSLIEFAEETKAENMFFGRYYGADLGMLETLPFSYTTRRPYQISMPVLGMVHGEVQNAYLAVIEKGASYAEIQAHPSGVITNFNFLYNAFLYNESYFQRTNRAGDGVTVIQSETNHFDILLHYRFLEGEQADYVGMARSYQAYLVGKGMLSRQEPAGAEAIGIRLEFLGAEQEKIFFWRRTIPMTTIAQMKAVLDALQVSNPQVIFYGWQPGGASSMPPDRIKLDRGLGNLTELEALIAEIAARGGTFNLYYDPLAAFRNDPASYSRHDLAMAITNAYIRSYQRGQPTYLFNPATIGQHLATFSQSVQGRLNAGLALDEIGSMLYADFRRGRQLNREQTISIYQSLLAQSGTPLGMYAPNDYLFAYTSAYYDIPLSDSGYTYTNASVPFLQIVLSGHIPYYGEALNFSANVETDLLKHAEYGMYPSFFVTYEGTARILNTDSNWIYVSSYQQLGGEINAGYAWLDALLGHVRGASIVAHARVADDVFATTYENGWQIIVNYRDTPVSVQGVTIPGRDAISRGALP